MDEIDVGRLQEGMPAEIKVGALPGKKIMGVLSKISLKAKMGRTRVFPVEIALTRPTARCCGQGTRPTRTSSWGAEGAC